MAIVGGERHLLHWLEVAIVGGVRHLLHWLEVAIEGGERHLLHGEEHRLPPSPHHPHQQRRLGRGEGVRG